VETLNEKIKSLEDTIKEMKNSTEAAERVQIEVNRVKAEKDNELALLSEKVKCRESIGGTEAVF